MSQSQASKAAVIRVKGVSFNYLQFLWSGIGQVRQQQAAGNYSGAMALVASFISYLPDSIKDDFRDRANHIQEVMDTIKSGSLEVIRKIPDLYIRGIYRNRLLQLYANDALTSFIDDLTTQLNKLGYMENLKVVTEGEADEAANWIEIDKKRRSTRKRRKKQGTADSPIGNMG